jgi:hypothetical protein
MIWPTAEGFGVWAVSAVVVLAAVTVCVALVEALPAKFASPAYVAVSVFVPAVVGVRAHVPAATVPTQLAPVPSLTVTLPVGVPPVDVTVYVTVIAWPTTDGLGVWPVSVVVVLAAPTVWVTPTEVLPAKFPSPA